MDMMVGFSVMRVMEEHGKQRYANDSRQTDHVVTNTSETHVKHQELKVIDSTDCFDSTVDFEG